MRQKIRYVMVGIFLLGITMLSSFSVEAAVAINQSTFPEKVVRDYVKEIYDTNKDGKLSDKELEKPKTIGIKSTRYAANNQEISTDKENIDFTGMENFPNIKKVSFIAKDLISCDWLKHFPHIKTVCISSGNFDEGIISLTGDLGNLESIEISGTIKKLNITGNKISNMRIICSKLPSKYKVYIPNVQKLYISGCAKLNFGVLKKLEYLYVSHSRLKKINLSQYPNLQSLSLDTNKKLRKINLEQVKDSLLDLDCSNNKVLSKLDVSKVRRLKVLQIQKCPIKKLNVSKNLKLERLSCNGLKVVSLDLYKNKSLKKVKISRCPLKKVVINKKFEKKEKNYIKKMAKKHKFKMIVKK